MSSSLLADSSTDSPSPSRRAGSHAHIVGWGADLDPANRPAYPKERTPPRLPGATTQPPVRQLQKVEVLHSTEREGMTPLFGSTVPPSGLSGSLRRLAFRYSENDLRHWLVLLFADRVNVVEGLGHDLRQGHVPNLFAEMGGPAEWRYNRAALLRKAVVTTAFAGLALYWFRQRGRQRLSRLR